MPVQESPPFTAEDQGATWQCASAARRDLFVADSAKYAPAYGGWRSVGASKGKKVATKADMFRAVVDALRYLNSSDAAHNKLLQADTSGVIGQGESNWKVIYATPAEKL
jgi:hypothetical protein